MLRFRPNAPADAAVSEAKCLTRLTQRGHPNLLRFFGYTSDPSNGTVCLVTEFASQGSLDGNLFLLTPSPLSPSPSHLLSFLLSMSGGVIIDHCQQQRPLLKAVS